MGISSRQDGHQEAQKSRTKGYAPIKSASLTSLLFMSSRVKSGALLAGAGAPAVGVPAAEGAGLSQPNARNNKGTKNTKKRTRTKRPVRSTGR